MKPLYFLLLIPLLLAGCEKNTPNETDDDDVSGLPPVTQTGANTFGCLVNGVPWTPKGNNGTANLSMDYDPSFNKGVFGISAYRLISQDDRTSLGIGITDSLNYLEAPFKRSLSSLSIYRAGYSDWDNCVLYSHYPTVSSAGSITVTKLDKTNRIIAGTFDFKLFELGCDTIHITKGRFDMGF